jgi:hypothetical protein
MSCSGTFPTLSIATSFPQIAVFIHLFCRSCMKRPPYRIKILQCRLFHVLLFSQVMRYYFLKYWNVKQIYCFHSSDTMYRFEIIRSYYFIMWGIWHEIMNSSVQSDICFVTELLNLVYRLNVRYSIPIFCQTQFMQEYPINKHEITIIDNQYLVKGD